MGTSCWKGQEDRGERSQGKCQEGARKDSLSSRQETGQYNHVHNRPQKEDNEIRILLYHKNGAKVGSYCR